MVQQVNLVLRKECNLSSVVQSGRIWDKQPWFVVECVSVILKEHFKDLCKPNRKNTDSPLNFIVKLR